MAHISSTQDNLWERLNPRKSSKQSSASHHAQNTLSSSTGPNHSQSPTDDDPKFTLFPDLPTELRQRIWFLNHPTEGEIINIALVTVHITRTTNHSKYVLPVHKFDGYQSLPANFHACADSRQFTIKRLGYEYCFGENFTHPIWFRPRVDGLHFESVAVVMELKYFKWSEESLSIFAKTKHVSIGGIVHHGYSAVRFYTPSDTFSTFLFFFLVLMGKCY
ncbi:hypothetical protein B0J14DRAFT_590722 [Halenospora varia]|nr:hypothetical protein B0J14DRAFT_590722 [Halenospora varia]